VSSIFFLLYREKGPKFKVQSCGRRQRVQNSKSNLVNSTKSGGLSSTSKREREREGQENGKFRERKWRKKQVGITWACCCLSLPPHHDLLLHQHHRRHPLILPQDSPSTAPPWLTIRYSPPPFTFSVFIVWLLRKRWEIRVVVGSSVRVGNVGSRFWVFFFYFSFFF
jgi:hypothetical protein